MIQVAIESADRYVGGAYLVFLLRLLVCLASLHLGALSLSAPAAAATNPDEMLKEALSVVSMRTMVTPQQIADQIVFICSERGRTISGQAISICGDTQMLP